MARLIVNLLLFNYAVLQYTYAKSSSISIDRTRRTQTLLTHQRNFQHGSLNDALLLSSSSAARNTRPPSLYSSNAVLERLRGGGTFLGGGSNNNKDTATLSTTKTSQDPQDDVPAITKSTAVALFTTFVALGYLLGHLSTHYIDRDTFKTCLIFSIPLTYAILQQSIPMSTLAMVVTYIASGYLLGYLTLHDVDIGTFKSIISSTKSTISTFFDKERFRSAIINNLNNIASKGNIGLFIYTFGFIFYETCGMRTSVVETCAGMAFGFKNGLMCSFIGKTCGSILAFTLGRTLLSNYVGNKLKDNESFSLIERGVAKNPTQSALIVRYSPFPQLIKNFSLSLTKSVSYPIFLLAILIHGLPFSILWAALGNDSSMRLRASDAGEIMASNKVLNWLLAFVTFFGFVVSPAITGWWLADLRKDSC